MTTADRIAVMHHGVIQQIGTPMDLFDSPANRFVADFVGSINLLPGRIERTNGTVVFESATFGRFSLGPAPFASGQAEIAIRPHTLALAETPSDSTRAWVAGTIRDREFVGEFVRYTIEVNDRTIIADEPHYIGRPPHASGSPIYVGIDPAQVRLLPPADPHIAP